MTWQILRDASTRTNAITSDTVQAIDLEAAKSLLAATGLTTVRLLASDHDFFASARPMIKEPLEAAGLTVPGMAPPAIPAPSGHFATGNNYHQS